MTTVLTGLRYNPAQSNNISISGVVCPHCFKLLERFHLFGPEPNEYGLNRRAYLGYCQHCNQSAEVQQYEYGKVWCIHCFRLTGAQDWTTVNPLPDPAPRVYTGSEIKNTFTQTPNQTPPPPVIKTGPGGDYTQDISDEQLESMLKQATEIFNKMGKLLLDLVDVIRAKKNRQHG